MAETSDDNLDFLKDVIDDYIVETTELIEQTEQDLVTLESQPDDKDLLNRIFRAVHTIKGTSSFLGFERMAALTHRGEDVLNKLRHGEMAVDAHVMDVLLETVDTARLLLNSIRENGSEGEHDIAGVLSQLDELLRESAAETGDAGAEQAAEEAPRTGEESPATPQADECGREEKTQDVEECESPAVAEKTPEKSARTAAAEKRQAGGKSRRKRIETHSSQTVRVHVERLDDVMDLVGELVLVRNRLSQLVSEIAGRCVQSTDNGAVGEKRLPQIDQLVSAIEQLQFISVQLQDAVMRTRMLPISNVFHRFPRVVRDLARESGKEVSLVIEGEDTELDKSVLELISDPLVHLIRNAVDHGIESPEDRAAAGKPRSGTVRLKAYQEGDHIVVEVEDDGRGIDPERVKKAAVERGLLSAEDVGNLSDRDALNLIFMPGFSTASEVTGTSGRGVGMDVVKTNVTRLNGQISVSSTVGKGTRFTVRLPLTLVIAPALLAEVAGETVVIPLASVLETARLRDHSLTTMHGRPVLRLRDEVLPLIDLGQILQLREEEASDSAYAVVVGLANRTAGLVVDRLLGQEEIVVKPLGEYLSQVPAFAGATILGDGKVRLVLDVGEILRLASEQSPRGVHFQARPTAVGTEEPAVT